MTPFLSPHPLRSTAAAGVLLGLASGGTLSAPATNSGRRCPTRPPSA